MEKSLLFEQWWPHAESHVRKVLRKAGDSPEEVDDRVQVTAERLWKSDKVFESVDHLTSWCTLTAKRLRTDEWRRSSRLAEAHEFPVPVFSPDAADAAEWGVRLRAVLEAIPTLPPSERAALFAVEMSGDRKAVVRLAVARHRARGKLRHVAEGAIAAFSLRAHRWSRRIRGFGIGEVQVAAAAVVTVAVALGAVTKAHDKAEPLSPAGRGASVSVGDPSPGSNAVAARPIARLTTSSDRSGSAAYVNPSPVPRVNVADRVQIAPSDEQDPPLYCGGETPVTPYRCADPPVPSIDALLGTDLF